METNSIFAREEKRREAKRDRCTMYLAVFGGRKEKVCRCLKAIDAISRQKIDIRVGMVPLVNIVFAS